MTQANLEALSREVERQNAIVDCKNLMGKVMYHGVAWLNRKMVELWSRREDCLLEMPWGIYDGRAGVERCYLEDFGDRSEPGWAEKRKGVMMLYTCDTPIVEVSQDGQSAKGVWISSGADTWREGDEHPQGYWRWGKYALDFVKEDGVWKIWKMRFYPFFLTKFDQSWTEAPAYDWAFFPVTPDRPREPPVYHYDGVAAYPTGQPPIPGVDD